MEKRKKGKNSKQGLVGQSTNKNKVGRPFIKVDLERAEELCAIGCTLEEVAIVLGVSHDVIEQKIRAEYDMSWKEFFNNHNQIFKVSLRRLQFRSAQGIVDNDGKRVMPPSVPMQIWLGKQYLGQKDRIENEHVDKSDIPLFEWAEDADIEDITKQKLLNEKQKSLGNGTNEEDTTEE